MNAVEKAARVLCEWHEEDSFDGDVCSACMSMAQALADAGLLAPGGEAAYEWGIRYKAVPGQVSCVERKSDALSVVAHGASVLMRRTVTRSAWEQVDE